jgi:hypothetical protein
MALHVTPVADRALAAPAAPVRRTAGNQASGPPDRKATETAAPKDAASFDSVLAYSRAATRSAAETATPAGRPPASSTASATATSTTTSSSSSSTSSGLSDFELLFGGSSYNPADPMAASRVTPTTPASTAQTPPTAESVFGPDVWMSDPIGLNPDGSSFAYNPIYFATESTAQTVAQIIGGTVVTENVFTQPGNAFVQQQPNYMVEMPNGALINPGLVASFYTFGFSQSQINTMIAQEVANTPPPAQTT